MRNAGLLAGLVAGLGRLYPQTEVTTHVEFRPRPLVDLLEAGKLDLALIGDHPGYELRTRPQVAYHRVALEPVFALLPVGHHLAGHPEVDFTELADEHWALPPADDDRTREYYAAACHRAGFTMRAIYDAWGTLLRDLVRDAHAVSLGQATFRDTPGIAIRPLSGTPLRYRHLIAHSRGGPLAEHSAQLGEIAAASYREAASSRNQVYGDWLSRYRPDDHS